MNKEEHLDAINDIRTIMERSSRFLSLSGLAGVVIGFIAIICIMAVYNYLGISVASTEYYKKVLDVNGQLDLANFIFVLVGFVLVLILSLIAGVIMAIRKANKMGLVIWDITAKRLLTNISLPLFAGGFYCLILLYHNQVALVAPATLIFYGLALINASKYTIHEIRFLGVLEVLIGLIASIWIDYGLLFWAFGFGILHIVYGITIYLKYEK